MQPLERITNEIPYLEALKFNKNGILMLGSWIEFGDILRGKLTHQLAKESSMPPKRRVDLFLGVFFLL